MSIFERISDKFRVKLREKIGNPIFSGSRRRAIKECRFTIISNNCWGGHVYRFFDLPYDSPTVGCYFFSEDYVKFVYNLRRYLEMDIKFINYEYSKYSKILQARYETNVPIGVMDDIEVIFLHYKTPEEAKQKWERRKKRIHWDNIIYKMSEQNLCSIEHLKNFNDLPAEKKLLFTSRDYGLESQIIFKDYMGEEEVKNDTLHFRKYVDLIKLINGKPFRR